MCERRGGWDMSVVEVICSFGIEDGPSSTTSALYLFEALFAGWIAVLAQGSVCDHRLWAFAWRTMQGLLSSIQKSTAFSTTGY